MIMAGTLIILALWLAFVWFAIPTAIATRDGSQRQAGRSILTKTL